MELYVAAEVEEADHFLHHDSSSEVEEDHVTEDRLHMVACQNEVDTRCYP